MYYLAHLLVYYLALLLLLVLKSRLFVWLPHLLMYYCPEGGGTPRDLLAVEIEHVFVEISMPCS